MKLVYRTRGGVTPQDKPKVYFTGHPADLSVYSESIFSDILRTQNCAIFYDEESDKPYDQDELFQELERMQLLVIPVTSRFLYQPNRGREVEFPFAIKHHIPVLPLMQEQNLESVFNKMCGNLQILNKYDSDPTALPYSEKLEKYLSSVLVGDELAEKIRAAFDAYVFLSYRKKDRKYAQDLMRLIHKNPLCQDIAIWYDEFLVPGENFNTAIADAMNKSQMFALAVTPNIIEADNYVMQVEYPEAVKLGKPIFPVELVPTNQEALWDSFEDIPPCANANDEPAFSSALLEAVENLTVQKNNKTPEHNYFIGLAYLNGIDVEVDRNRALSLITGAAEAGLLEAIEKLANMYRSGDGVARNYQAAIQWQERLVAYCQSRYEKTGTLNDGLSYGCYLQNLGDSQRELGSLTAAKESYQQMRDLCQQMSAQYNNMEIRHNLSVSYDRLGDVSRAEGGLSEAKSYYQQSLELRRQLCEETGTVEARLALSASYDRLGDTSKAEGNLTEAEKYYLQSLELNRQLCKETETVEVRRCLSISCQHLGDISQAENKLDEAKAYFQQSFELCRQLYEETGTVEARRDLSVGYNRLGVISQAEGKLTEAKEYFLQSLELFRQLCEETGAVQARQDLSAGCQNLGNISWAEGGLTEAKKYFLQSLELSRQLCEETGSVEVRWTFAISCYQLGEISRAEGELTEAKLYFLESLGRFKQLCEETGNVQARQNLLTNYTHLGYVSQAQGILAEAMMFYLQSLALSTQLYEETKTVQALNDLAFSYCCVGNISDLEERKDMFLQAYHIWNGLSEQFPDIAEFARRRDELRNLLGELSST